MDDPIVVDDLERLSFRVDRHAYTDDDVAAQEMAKILAMEPPVFGRTCPARIDAQVA